MSQNATNEGSAPSRRYDKGERRYKHVGKGSEPEISYDTGNPRKWVGKCPANLTADDHLRLVSEAIPAENGDRELPVPKKIYAVHEGAIYEGQTSDRGWSYHGYPYRGRLPKGLVEALRDMARVKECEAEFDQWLKTHIEFHGS